MLELYDSYDDGMNNVNQYMGDWSWYYLKLNDEMFVTLDLHPNCPISNYYL